MKKKEGEKWLHFCFSYKYVCFVLMHDEIELGIERVIKLEDLVCDFSCFVFKQWIFKQIITLIAAKE